MADQGHYFFSSCFQTPKTQEEREEEMASYQTYRDLISSLPLEDQGPVRNYHGFWFRETALLGLIAFRDRFTSRPGDIWLTTFPKSGTTWLKALAFATIYRKDHSFADHPLLRRHPQDCAPFLEELFSMRQHELPDLDVLPTPRLLATHTPYSLLPDSITASDDCRVVYLCRDPRDTIVSTWHFAAAIWPQELSPLNIDTVFELFCKGIGAYGPLWDHILEYWHASLRRPQNVLFLKYEDLKQDPASNLRKLAEFIGCPFSPEELDQGVVKGIAELCSIDHLRSLEVNKTGARGKEMGFDMHNSSFFRKGEVGDWMEHLTSEMVDKLDRIMQEKLEGSGLSFANSAAMSKEMLGGAGDPTPSSTQTLS